MEFRAVCSASAMTARMASCFFGRGEFECSSFSANPPFAFGWCPPSLCEPSKPTLLVGEGEMGGLPRDLGGGVGKVW